MSRRLVAAIMAAVMVLGLPEPPRALAEPRVGIGVGGYGLTELEANIEVVGCPVGESTAVVVVRLAGRTQATLRQQVTQSRMIIVWVPELPGEYSLHLACTDTVGKVLSTASTEHTILRQTSLGVLCQGSSLTLHGSGGLPGVRLTGWVDDLDQFWEEGLFYSIPLGPMGAVAADGSYTWTLDLPKDLGPGGTLILLAGTQTSKDPFMWTFTIRKCSTEAPDALPPSGQ